MEPDDNAGSLVFRLIRDGDDRWIVTPDGGEQRVASHAELKNIFSAALSSAPDDATADTPDG